MPPRRPRRGRIVALGIFTLGALGCCSLILGVLYLGLPAVVNIVGQPAPEVDPLSRVLLAGYLWLNLEAIDLPAGEPGSQYQLEVSSGENATNVIGRLKAAGIVEDDSLLRNYLQFRGLDTGIEAGTYILDGGMTIREIAIKLQDADPHSMNLVVLEGWRREQIAEAIDLTGAGFRSTDFISATQRIPQDFVYADQFPVFASLEGFLFPDTYSISAEMNAEDLVMRMLDNFAERVTADIIAGIEEQGLNMYQAVTLASIVEREAVSPDERDLIASVFINRLELGMLLEADPTVQYAVGKQSASSWWKAELTFDDLEIDSPYNTYRYHGLPVGPIANPGLDSIRAVAFPADSNYLYFRASCDDSGKHSFAFTFEEHQQNACD